MSQLSKRSALQHSGTTHFGATSSLMTLQSSHMGDVETAQRCLSTLQLMYSSTEKLSGCIESLTKSH